MGMAIRDHDWTVERINALPDDGNRYEVIDGWLFVTPTPTNLHQSAQAQLLLLLHAYARTLSMVVLTAPTAITFSQRREVQPDVLVMPSIDGRVPHRFSDVGRLVLAIEILSPGTRRTDTTVKRALYQDEGVPEYWIVDTEAKTVERWRPDSIRGELLTSTIAWQPDASVPPLHIDLVELFHRTEFL
jgi:Uma2 family endonuclease